MTLGIIQAALLSLLPGAWLAFGLRRTSLGFLTRAALAAALSPGVIGIQFLVLRLLGLRFEQAVPLLLLANLPAAALIVRFWLRRSPRGQGSRRVLLGGTLAYLVVAASLAIPWLWDAGFRRFSWHGLIHTDIIYALAQNQLPPEEPQLAGIAIAYPWVGHAYWAILGSAANLSPTVVYILTNLLLAAAIGMLFFETARRLGASAAAALALPLLLAVGVNLPGVVGWSIVLPNASAGWWALLGDLRTAPFVQKLMGFEVVALGLAAFAALVCVTVAALGEREIGAAWLAAAIAAVVGVLYPILYPPALVLVATAAALAFQRWRPGSARPRWTLFVLGALTVLSAAIAVLFVEVYTAGQARSIVSVSSPAAFAKKLVWSVLALGPFVWLGVAAVRDTTGARRDPLAALVAGGMAAIGLHLLLRLGGLNEYKFVFAAGMCLAPAAVVGVDRLSGTKRIPAVALTVLPILLAASLTSYAIRRLPQEGTPPLPLQGHSFWLTLDPVVPEAGWIGAVRAETPVTTVLVVNRPRLHTQAFSTRSLFAPSDGEAPHFGYNLWSRDLLRERGYDEALVRERSALLDTVYGSEMSHAPATSTPARNVLDQLLALRRPIALVFGPEDNKGYLTWLEANGIGVTLFADEHGYLVRFIEPVTTEDGA